MFERVGSSGVVVGGRGGWRNIDDFVGSRCGICQWHTVLCVGIAIVDFILDGIVAVVVIIINFIIEVLWRCFVGDVVGCDLINRMRVLAIFTLVTMG